MHLEVKHKEYSHLSVSCMRMVPKQYAYDALNINSELQTMLGMRAQAVIRQHLRRPMQWDCESQDDRNP